MRSARKFVNSFTVSLAVVCALYVALIVGTTLALNHEQRLHLNDVKIGRIWLPANYSPDDGYEVPASAVMRDLRSELLFGAMGSRALDALAAMGLSCLVLQLTLRVADRRLRHLKLAERPSRPQTAAPKAAGCPAPAQHSTMRPALGKAVPYGEPRHCGPAKVLPFAKR